MRTMAERNKKRTSSFRKLFPSIFFSHKSKEKHSDKGSPQARLKESTDSSSANNHYQNPRSISKSDRYNQQTDQYGGCIYENLTIRQSSQPICANDALSNHSSSSTLVSESVKTSPGYSDSSRRPGQFVQCADQAGNAARPQVPPRPHDTPQPQQNNQYHTQYPDVYYHSLEKITDTISPLNKVEVYKASKSQSNPEPVGAEIKKNSTTFLISPKKEAEVRTILPTRAKSLSFNKVKGNAYFKTYTDMERNELTVTKPYNYSAPTSPIPLKVPNMPKTVSPYQHVRKTMMEAEEKRNSLTRVTTHNRSTPSPRIDVARERPLVRVSSPTSTLSKENPKKLDDKEKTRQKVEAFYWQKLKELKEKEDEYYLKQSLNNTNNENVYRNSNCSTPNSFVVEPKSFSLPRGQNLNSYNRSQTAYYVNPPFVRGAPERRTDTFITKQSGYIDSDIIYRHPEKLNQRFVSTMSTLDAKQPTIALRGSLTRSPRNGNQQPKRVSFEEQSASEVTMIENSGTKNVASGSKPANKNLASTNSRYENSPRVVTIAGNGSKVPREPPRPPARTTSVAKSYNARNNKINFIGKGPYSESESGSEAGEIQRILQNTAQKEEDWHGDGSRIDDDPPLSPIPTPPPPPRRRINFAFWPPEAPLESSIPTPPQPAVPLLAPPTCPCTCSKLKIPTHCQSPWKTSAVPSMFLTESSWSLTESPSMSLPVSPQSTSTSVSPLPSSSTSSPRSESYSLGSESSVNAYTKADDEAYDTNSLSGHERLFPSLLKLCPSLPSGLSDGEASRGPIRGRNSRRDDPRRHTLAGNHLLLHPHQHSQINSLDIELYGRQGSLNAPEYATVTKYRDMKPNRILDPRTKKPPLPRYPPPTNNLLFDDDPGIMSEVETSSTGFRRGGKQRSSLPVVRTPSKTLERPLGLVFLQYRSETKRALLPNEITSIDTVKALFVRSFPKQLTMQYMDSPLVKIYIHDSNKDMFYELEDVRAHLRDIRDRSVLRLFESTDMTSGVFPGAVGVGSLAIPPAVPPAAPCSGPSSWDQDQNYFSEPEIDSDYHHQHVHKSKVKAPAYYMGTSAPSTLPRGGSLLRAFSPAAPPPVPADRVKNHPNSGGVPAKPVRSYLPGSGSERCFPFSAECPRPEQLYTIPGHGGDGYMSSPERGAARVPYEDPYYTQYLGPAAGRPTITPVIDEEISDGVLIDDSYQMYGVNAMTTAPRPMPRPPYDARMTPQVDDMQRLRVEKMERQLANLTGLVQKALQAPGTAAPVVAPRQDFSACVTARPPSQEKSVSFDKSVSFSDDPPDMNSPKQHSPQNSADTKPTKPAIKSSTLPRTSSQERDRLKPAPPPKPAGLVGQQLPLAPQRTYTIDVSPDFFSQLRVLQKQTRDLRLETRNLRRSTLTHAIQMRQLMADTIVKIGSIAASYCEHNPESQLTREEEIYRQDMLLLENDLYELEATVERLRGQAANRETRVNMTDIESIAMVLSKSSKTVADWKLKFPILQETVKVKLTSEMEKVVRKEKMLEEEPERLELALRRCKKLTGTLVTLKRLACVQEQRLPLSDGRTSPGSSQSSTFTAGPSSEEFASDSACAAAPAHNKGTGGDGCIGRGATGRGSAELRPENALDALLDELQTFAKPAERARGDGQLRRLHSYPSGSDTDASPPVRARGQHPPKPPVPERHPELLAMAQRRAPPPPPPRTTSRSPLASPTSPASPASPPRTDAEPTCDADASTQDDKSGARQALLEQRHQELLKKQKALQEQYARLQMIQRTGPTLPPSAQPDLKKTGSESNLLTKMNLNLAAAATSGSMTHLAGEGGAGHACGELPAPAAALLKVAGSVATTNKVYETDIL